MTRKTMFNLRLSHTIIIIMSCHQHGYPWPSLATPPYCSSLLAGPKGYFPYPDTASVCRFELVVLLLLGHMRGSIGVHYLWARPCFSSSVLHVCWWDTASKVGELVYQFQRATAKCGKVTCLIKTHVFRFVCIDMKANGCGGSSQSMQ